MYQARTRLQRDVLTTDNGHDTIMERVLQRQHFQRRALANTDDMRALSQAITCKARIGQFSDQHQIALRGMDKAIFMFGMHTHRLIGGQRPRRGGPDHCISFRIAR